MTLTEKQSEALSMNSSVCVSAGAGTGKTYLLTERYLACLEQGNVEAKDILALTYTDKAAAEMREKIGSALKERGKIDARFIELFNGFARCSIGTFHGFASSLLHEFASEANLDSGFSIMDELDRHELVNLTIRSVLDSPPNYIRDNVVVLFKRLNEYAIKNYISELIHILPEAENWFETLRKNPDEIITHWRKLWVEKTKDFRDSIVCDRNIEVLMGEYENLKDKNEFYRLCLECFNELKNTDDADEIYLQIKKIAGLKLPRGKLHSSITKEYHKSFKEKYTECKKYQSQPSFEDERTRITLEILNSLWAVTKYIYDKISEDKERRGILDFDDLIRHTRDLLENDSVKSELNKRYKYILVDEVQDNDPVLTEIVNILCGNVNESGKLLAVGDMKQSIYGFRGADPQGFSSLSEMIEKNVSLDVSFRSVPEIVDFVNKVFSSVFADPQKAYDAKYSPLKSFRKDCCGSVSRLIISSEDKNKKTKAEIEAESAVSWISESVSRGLKVYSKDGTMHNAGFGDFAVLMERRTHIGELISAFEKYNVPYLEYKGQSFYKRQEVYDFINLMKAIVYPEDDVSLYGTLRSPYFCVSDAELCSAGMETGYLFNEKIQSYALKNPKSKTAECNKRLEKWRKLEQTETLIDFINDLISESGILTFYSYDEHGAEKIANLEKIIDIARSRCRFGLFSIYDFLRMIDTSIDEEIKESEGAADIDDRSSVKIMTVHASKGLEFPVVLLIFAGDAETSNRDDFVFDSNVGAGISFPLEEDITSTRSFVKQYLDEETKSRRLAERKRLFYVAATRARDHLVICGTDSNKSRDDENSNSNSFLGMLNSAIYDNDINEISGPFECQNIIKRSLPEIPESFEDENFCIEQDDERKCSLPEYTISQEKRMKEGSLLHEIFSGADAYITSSLYGMPEKAIQYKSAFEDFMKSDLMKDSKRSFCELSVVTDSGVKRIDRLVEYSDGSYAIIDYKSESADTAVKSKLIVDYRAQLNSYSEIMSLILREEVPAFLYFAGDKTIIKV